MKVFRFAVALFLWISVPGLCVEPTEVRDWKAKSGHTVTARAMSVTAGSVLLKKRNGQTVSVPLDKFSAEDRERLERHFKSAAGGEAGGVADDLAFPLGVTTEEISCGDEYSYFLYLPKTLEKGERHPVLFLMSPGGGSAGVADRYVAGAERNRWIIAVSKQSKNGFRGSYDAVDSMIGHVKDSLPVDTKRLYCSGFSGGSRMAFWTAQKHDEIAGVIACGAGGATGSSKQVVYGLCGSNCFNRGDMANSFKNHIKNKESVLRFFVGRHSWANAVLCEDAITYLNGVFLTANKSRYPEQLEDFRNQVRLLVEEALGPDPLRAFLWADFLEVHKMGFPSTSESHATLGAVELNQHYLSGLTGIGEFAQKQFGSIKISQWEADPAVSAACKREAQKYVGLPWEDVLKRMAEDAQKF